MNPKLALVFVLHSPFVPPDNWFGLDKVKHFMMSAFAESAAYSGLRAVGTPHSSAMAGAVGATVALGIGKEIRDLRSYGHFSLKDLTWDLAGAAAAVPLLEKTER